MNSVESHNLVTRKSSTQVFDKTLVNYDINRRTVFLADSRTLIFQNRITERVEKTLEMDFEIVTSFALNNRWYLILPKFGNKLELLEYKKNKRQVITFNKMSSDFDENSPKVLPRE